MASCSCSAEIIRMFLAIGCLLSLVQANASVSDCSYHSCLHTFYDGELFIDLTSPAYPANYTEGRLQKWVVAAPVRVGMSMTVRDFELEEGESVEIGIVKGNGVTRFFELTNAESIVGKTFNFSERTIYILLKTDNDGRTARGFWFRIEPLTRIISSSIAPSSVEPTPLYPKNMSRTTNMTTTHLPFTVPISDLFPSMKIGLAISLPLAIALILLAFLLGAAIVWIFIKRKRAIRIAEGEQTGADIEMAENPPFSPRRDINLNTKTMQADPVSPNVYNEIGEGEYNTLFDNPVAGMKHPYQPLLRKERSDSETVAKRMSSKDNLSVELDNEFCQLTDLIDEMLDDISHQSTPNLKSYGQNHRLMSGGHASYFRSAHALPPLPRVRAHTGDFDCARGTALRHSRYKNRQPPLPPRLRGMPRGLQLSHDEHRRELHRKMPSLPCLHQVVSAPWNFPTSHERKTFETQRKQHENDYRALERREDPDKRPYQALRGSLPTLPQERSASFQDVKEDEYTAYQALGGSLMDLPQSVPLDGVDETHEYAILEQENSGNVSSCVHLLETDFTRLDSVTIQSTADTRITDCGSSVLENTKAPSRCESSREDMNQESYPESEHSDYIEILGDEIETCCVQNVNGSALSNFSLSCVNDVARSRCNTGASCVSASGRLSPADSTKEPIGGNLPSPDETATYMALPDDGPAPSRGRSKINRRCFRGSSWDDDMYSSVNAEIYEEVLMEDDDDDEHEYFNVADIFA